MATSTAISSKYEFNILHILTFYISTLIIVLGTDLLKTYVGHTIKEKLNATILLRIRQVTGGFLIAFGLYLIYKVFFLH